MPEPSNGLFQILPTPNPSEVGFRVAAEAALMMPSQMPTVGQKYGDIGTWLLKSRASQEMLRDYEYTFMEQEGNTLWFYFAKSKTDAEKRTPFRTTWSYGNHSWPPILKALILIPDSTFPRSTNVAGQDGKSGIVNGPSYYVREVYVPDANEGSRFKLEEYLAPTPFIIPQWEAPQPASVSYDVPGRSGTFPKCLHKELTIQMARTGTAMVIGDTSSELGGVLGGQVFPKTNFVNWESYPISDKQTFQNGYYRQKITVYPPEEPTTVTNY